MQKLNIDLEYCYGIKKLSKELDFSGQRTFAIYAPNGVMKTSLAKTFMDLSLGENSKDLIYPDRKTLRTIRKEDGSDINKEQVFVITPYHQDFSSEKISTLVVNKELKNRYDKIHLKIDEEKNRLLKELKKLSGLRDTAEEEFSNTFTSEAAKFFVALVRIEKEVLDTKEAEFSDISYKEIFNDKVFNFLQTKDFKKKIAEYMKRYDELIENSKYFKKGVFNHNNASVIAKSLMDNGFFEAKHSVSLNTKETRNEIHTKEELEKVIEEEKSAILNNPELLKAFEEIDSKLRANKELRDFRDYLLSNQKITTELDNLGSFRQKLWISYLKSHKDLYSNLLTEFRSGEKELSNISEKAKTEGTQWMRVVDEFNRRFFVPFQLIIGNQEDVILKSDVPIIDFFYKEDTREQVSVERSQLLKALSSGEERALYILNIIFEVNAREKENQETLFIIDDIADSFDYKNKYAIIEYLKDISEKNNFYQIILTHNFDFFRTIESRFVGYKHCLMVEKTRDNIEIVDGNYIKNPFTYWMGHLDDDKKLIASIPFVRNLIEYTKGSKDKNFLKLTALLHMKSDSDSISKGTIECIYNDVFPEKQLNFTNKDKRAIELIFELADDCLKAAECINLENKIVLSIAIRLKAEKYILSKVSDKSEVDEKQTRKLIERFKDEYRSQPSEQENIKLLERVNLMTPENIHINSFMYEPILDMSDEHLKNLYTDAKMLNL